MKSVWISNYPYLLMGFKVYVCGHDLTVKNVITDLDLMTGAMVFLTIRPGRGHRAFVMGLADSEVEPEVSEHYRKVKRSRITFGSSFPGRAIGWRPAWCRDTPFWKKDVLTCDDMLQEIEDNPHESTACVRAYEAEMA